MTTRADQAICSRKDGAIKEKQKMINEFSDEEKLKWYADFPGICESKKIIIDEMIKESGQNDGELTYISTVTGHTYFINSITFIIRTASNAAVTGYLSKDISDDDLRLEVNSLLKEVNGQRGIAGLLSITDIRSAISISDHSYSMIDYDIEIKEAGPEWPKDLIITINTQFLVGSWDYIGKKDAGNLDFLGKLVSNILENINRLIATQHYSGDYDDMWKISKNNVRIAVMSEIIKDRDG